VNTAIITGAAGFIGSHLSVALVKRGWSVVGVDNFDGFYPRAAKLRNLAPLASCDYFDLHEADIRDADRMRRIMSDARPQAVFHLAALAGVRPSLLEPARFADVNINGTASVLEAARQAGCGAIVFASSSSVYGNNPKAPFSEDDPVEEQISPYAATKRACEIMCQEHARSQESRLACLRFFTVYGPAQRPDLAIMKFMRRIARGEPVPMFGDGSTSRDYTYIDDVIAGVLAAWDRLQESPGAMWRIWNLGSAAPIRLRDLIEEIARTVGRAARIDRQPTQRGDVDRTWADLTRSRIELGYDPRTPLTEGLRRQWRWLQETDLTKCEAAPPATTRPS
jgi:UDP-glucuronate 4-epimerase